MSSPPSVLLLSFRLDCACLAYLRGRPLLSSHIPAQTSPPCDASITVTVLVCASSHLRPHAFHIASISSTTLFLHVICMEPGNQLSLSLLPTQASLYSPLYQHTQMLNSAPACLPQRNPSQNRGQLPLQMIYLIGRGREQGPYSEHPPSSKAYSSLQAVLFSKSLLGSPVLGSFSLITLPQCTPAKCLHSVSFVFPTFLPQLISFLFK